MKSSISATDAVRICGRRRGGPGNWEWFKALIVTGRLRFFELFGWRRLRSSPGSPSGVLERIMVLVEAGGGRRSRRNEKGYGKGHKVTILNKTL